MFSKVLYSFVFVSLLSSSLNALANFVVIANDNAGLSSVSSKDFRAIYLKKKLYLASGEMAVVAGIKEGDARDLFISDVLRKSESTLNSYWARLMFSGRANPPRLFSSSDEVLEFVAATPGAIAYIADDAELIDGVKLLSLTAK